MLKKAKIRVMPLLTAVLATCVTASAAFWQSNEEKANPVKEQPAQSLPAAFSPSPVPPSRSLASITNAQRSKKEEIFYKSVWGIEKLEVREAASGVLLRFSYRVADANKAAVLNDKKAMPYLIDRKTGAVLQIPTMPKVGLLRQTANPENGHEYWMVFSNKGNFIKPLSRVDIVIGTFRANGLLVR